MPDNDEPQPFELITPENITDEQRDQLVPLWNAELYEGLRPRRGELSKRAALAAKAQSTAELQSIAQLSKAYQAQLSRWNCGAGKRVSEALQILEGSFGQLADDIAAALNGELPGQEPPTREGDEWKSGGSSQE